MREVRVSFGGNGKPRGGSFSTGTPSDALTVPTTCIFGLDVGVVDFGCKPQGANALRELCHGGGDVDEHQLRSGGRACHENISHRLPSKDVMIHTTQATVFELLPSEVDSKSVSLEFRKGM